MARPRKGEEPKGSSLPCRYCGVLIYRPPSQATSSTYFHMKCFKANSFNFPCAVCKKPVYTQPAQLKYRARSTCSPICRRSLRREQAKKRRLEHGYTKHQLDRIARNSVEAVEWRKAVFERDNYACQVCHLRGGYIEADHIKPWAYFPNLRFELSNGRTLCRPCHDRTKESYKVMRRKYEKDTAQAKEQDTASKDEAAIMGGM